MQKLQNYIQNMSKSKFVQNLSITFVQSVLTKLLGFLVTLILVRNLGPSNYGIYSFIMVNVYVLSALFDFGMENTAIRFSNRDKEKQDAVFGLYFLTKSVILFIFIFVSIVWGKQILLAAHKPELIEYLPFFLCGFLGESLFFVNDTYLQSIQKFTTQTVINVTRYIVLFGAVLILYFNKLLLLKYVMLSWLIPLIFTLFFIPRYLTFIKSFLHRSLSKHLLKEIFNYEKWMFVLASVNGVLARIDVYMISIWVSYAQIGVYSAAFNLVSIVSFLPVVFGKVMLPKMAETSREELFDMTIRMVKPIIAISCLLALIIPIFPIIVPFLFGSKYDDSIIIVQILSVLTLISFILLPFEQSMYPLGKPKYTAFLKFVQLILIIIMNLIFIPRFGIVSAAINLVITKIIYGILLINVFKAEKRKLSL